MPGPSRSRSCLRRDAARNREQLLIAAREVFGRDGIDAPLEAVARRAGVGIATLYRRFPERSNLVEALFAPAAREYAAASERALRARDAWEGFCELIVHVCAMQTEDPGFSRLLGTTLTSAPGLYPDMHRAFLNIRRLVARARREGSMRRDAHTADVLWILVCHGAYLRAMGEIAPRTADRYVALMLEGLRAPGSERLPSAPTHAQVDEAIGGVRQP